MFNPNEHVIQLKSKQGSQDYLPVQWRLVWFREQYPQGTIETEELLVDLDREIEVEAFVWNNEKRRSEKVTKRAKGYARFKATVTDGKGGRATGTGSESAADFPDFVEKAETKAIGRALAALGFGTQFAPDLNEEHRIVDSPVNRETATSNQQDEQQQQEQEVDAPITEAQMTSIRNLCQRLKKPEPNLTEVTYLGAKKVIQQLTADYRKLQQSGQRSAS